MYCLDISRSDVLLAGEVVLEHEKLIQSGSQEDHEFDGGDKGNIFADFIGNCKGFVFFSCS
jgi:hypothetical protein